MNYPTTVGELRKALRQYPDDTPFDDEVWISETEQYKCGDKWEDFCCSDAEERAIKQTHPVRKAVKIRTPIY